MLHDYDTNPVILIFCGTLKLKFHIKWNFFLNKINK